MTRVLRALLALLAFAPALSAQTPPLTAGETHLRRLLTVPIGALPPMGMLMPASRNNSYWVWRLQGGTQWENIAGDLAAVAGGVDFQWRGGSTFGLTAGYQYEDCEDDVTGCASHPLFGARARVNVITGGPTVAGILGDNSATTTLGTEIGLGYAPNAVFGDNACAVDVGLPISVALFQRVRMLTFFTPGIAWDVRCPVGGSTAVGASTFIGAGVGIQQLFHPGLDVSIGAQRFFRSEPGIQIGVSVTFVRIR